MTSLLVWFASDKKANLGFVPASVYIASDSRLTWDNGSTAWDCGKKVFASVTEPEIFGFCGDSRFAALVLSQAIGAIDSRLLFQPEDTVQIKLEKVRQLFAMAWQTFPKQHLTCSTSILHVSREGEGVKSRFWLQEHHFNGTTGRMWSEAALSAPFGEYSRAWVIRGTGSDGVMKSIDARNRRYQDRHTSRAVFKAFCDSLREEIDTNSGGPPQLVSLYRIGNGRPHGVIWENKRYFEGLPTLWNAQKDEVPWRNDSFEIIDQRKKARKSGAARHVSVLDFGECS